MRSEQVRAGQSAALIASIFMIASCDDVELERHAQVVVQEQAGVVQGTWNQLSRFWNEPGLDRDVPAAYLGRSSAILSTLGVPCSSTLVGVDKLWTAEHCGPYNEYDWGTNFSVARLGRYTEDGRNQYDDEADGFGIADRVAARAYVMQRFRELGLDPSTSISDLYSPDGQLRVSPQFLGDALSAMTQFRDGVLHGRSLAAGTRDGDLAVAGIFRCQHLQTDNEDGRRDLVSVQCEPNYFKARGGEYIPVYPGEIWGWVEVSPVASERGEGLFALSANRTQPRRDMEVYCAQLAAEMGVQDQSLLGVPGCPSPLDSVLLSPGGTRRDSASGNVVCGVGDGPWNECVRHDLDALPGSSGGGIVRYSSYTIIGAHSGGSECYTPEGCESAHAVRIWNKYAEASSAFRSEARDSVSAEPKDPTAPPIAERGEDYWSQTNTGSLVGVSSPSHAVIELRCTHRGDYVNGVTAHMGFGKDREVAPGIGGLAIHCRPDGVGSTRDRLRLETHSVHAAGAPEFLFSATQLTDDDRDLPVVVGPVHLASFRYAAFRNLYYTDGISPVTADDRWRRGQERLCGPGFSLHGFGSRSTEPTLLTELASLDCRDLEELPLDVSVPQGFDLRLAPASGTMRYSHCAGDMMVGVAVHLHPQSLAVSGIEPICGGFDTPGMTL